MLVNMADYIASEWAQVYKGAQKIKRNDEEAEDLVQRIFEYFARKGGLIEMQQGKRPWAYVYAAMYQTHLNDMRKLKYRKEVVTDDGQLPQQTTLQPEVHWKLDLAKYLDKRPRKNKRNSKTKILELMLEDYDGHEIAKSLKMSNQNVYHQREELLDELRRVVYHDNLSKGFANKSPKLQ